ncbi:MAG: ATP-binding protein [Thermoanaerobaculia bacterium]
MPGTHLRIFISSVQRELESVRSDLKAYLLGDPFLQKFVAEVFLFEDLPASDRRADETYLAEIDRCHIYIGIFGNEYGSEDAAGVSPTECEYDRASEKHKTRLVYVWGLDDSKRTPKMRALIRKAEGDVIRRKVDSTTALTAEVYASLVDYLERHRALRIPPFDTAAPETAKLKDISRKRTAWFLERARRERGFALAADVANRPLLAHLNLLDGSRPVNAALLLFGLKPQSFHRSAETKCMLVHGSEYQRPFASYQVYGGDLFEQADLALSFVLSNIKRSVGTRASSITAPAEYELPPDAVGEAIINALVHRDYNSNASVEVRLFTDRLEVWNPGRLPGNLTAEDLREDHASIPANPLIADPMYLARYIEKAGTGTQAMIRLCREAGLPEPDFEERSGSVVVTIWRDWLTPDLIASLALNERQRKALTAVKASGRIVNAEYQKLTGASQKMAARDLGELVEKGLLRRVGEKRGSYYVIATRK